MSVLGVCAGCATVHWSAAGVLWTGGLETTPQDVKFRDRGRIAYLVDAPRSRASHDELERPASCGSVQLDTGYRSAGIDRQNGWTVSDGIVDVHAPAHPFTATVTGNVCEFEIVAGHSVGTNLYDFFLHSDEGGLPGALAGKAENVVLINHFGDDPSPQAVTIPAPIEAGKNYWITVRADGGGGTFGVVNFTRETLRQHRTLHWNGTKYEDLGMRTGGCWYVVASTDVFLEVGGSCPGTVTLSWRNATPDQSLGLLYAAGTGAAEIPPSNPCAGTALGLSANRLQLVNTVPSGPEGEGQRAAPIGVAACGGYVQIVEAGACTTSNVVRLP